MKSWLQYMNSSVYCVGQGSRLVRIKDWSLILRLSGTRLSALSMDNAGDVLRYSAAAGAARFFNGTSRKNRFTTIPTTIKIAPIKNIVCRP